MQRIWKGIWITDERFADLTPVNVFHKELDPFSYTPDPNLANSHILFRRDFELDQFSTATLYIPADDYYKLYINGRFVDQGPAPGNPAHYYYNTIEIGTFLKPGKNVIAVHTYYQGEINRVWVSGDARQGLIADVVVDGKIILSTDCTWRVAKHSGYSAMGLTGYKTQYLERYDSGSTEEGFETLDFDASEWGMAKARKNVDYLLFAQPIKQLDIYRVKPRTISRFDNVVRIDFGRAYVGYFEAIAYGKRGSEISIHTGMELMDDGRVRYNMRSNCVYNERWALSGQKWDILKQYDYKPFRYVELELPDDCELTEEGICAIVRHYPYVEKLDINSKDEKLKKVLRLCVDTLKYGVQDKYMDSLDREKGQYLGDEAFASYAHMLLTGQAELACKFLRDAAETVTICKGMMSESICSFPQEIADYSLQFAGNVYRYYEYTHDMGLLIEMYPIIMGILEYFERYEREDGLLENVTEKWNIVDWPANMRDDYDFPLTIPIGSGCHNVINGYYIGMIDDVNRIRNVLGITPLNKREKLEKAYVKAFYDQDKALFKDSETSEHISEHGNILPLAFNIGLDERTKDSILNLIRSKRWTCNVYIGIYMLYGLQRHGEYGLLKELLTDENAWLRMLSEGATSTFEAWYKDQKWNTSLFHLAGVIPLIFADTCRSL